jgi:hypothetical protein
MKIKINGVALAEQSLSTKFQEVVDQTNTMIAEKNRDIRRSKPMKKVLAFLGLITTLGITTVAKAEGPNLPILSAPSIFGTLASKVTESASIKDSIGLGAVARKDTVVWKMNDWLQNVLLNTQDFFDNPQILTVFNSIWYVCMSFVTIIIAKKGFDMIKAKMLGTSTLGAGELIIRLLACVVMTFLSLDIMQLGIELSNLTITTLFKAIEAHLIPYEALQNTNSLGLIFWFIGYMLMFVVLGIQYWIRQITIVLLGVLTPVANMSWVVDGGSMLGTLIREFVTLIATPLVHGLVLGLGSVIMFEVSSLTGNSFMDSMNSVLIGFSTMFLMVFTPSFLRKFTSGSMNPLKPFIGIGKGLTANTIKLARFLTK